jgi:phosphate transport system ATP-binding protein
MVQDNGSVEVRGLHVRYGENEVVRGVSVAFAPRTATAIIGPSGCGKSTLLRCLNRLTDLTPGCHVEGSIVLDDREVAKMDPVLLRRRIGMVFQKPNPFPMSIKENVVYGVRARGGKIRGLRAICEEALRKAILWEEVKDRLDDPAHSLSLGQQQRLCIARTLAVSPEVILMDEPAASLDPVSTAALETSIRAMKAQYTVVLVTHDLHQARRVADYTVFMSNGIMIESGETGQFFAAPQKRETRDYIEGRLPSTAPAATPISLSEALATTPS